MVVGSLRRMALAVGTSLALLFGFVTVAPPVQAASLSGHDVSWPQCSPSVGGFGLPMPPVSTQFVIIGLTRGLPFTENPCLGSQVSWASTNNKRAHGYAMAGFPTAAQLSTYGARGPWAATTRAGQLSNVGYAEAQFAVASMNRIGFRPPVVWIDVEPRPAQPWPTGTTAQQRDNRLIIEGLMRGLRDSGFSYGLYSYASGWNDITGSWRLPGVPVWATAGRLDYPGEALDRCRQPSFSGGHVYISQWYDDTRDYDLTCDPYVFTPLAIPASTLSRSTADFDGDWNNDILARVAATGDLLLYRGRGNGTVWGGVRIGVGWAPMGALETPGDFNGDGKADVLAREAATGSLWLYRGNGVGGWQPRIRVGQGWNVFDSILAPGDLNGDQLVDVLARERATGYLWLYRGNGVGGWLPRVRVGSGWNGFNAIVGPGDFTGDGHADLLAREAATGYLWLYPGNGAGGWLQRVRVGHGWNSLTTVMSPGDLDGDRAADVVGRDGQGNLWLYRGNGAGGLLPRTQVGTGWNALNLVF